MSRPTPDPRSTRKLVWASDEVIARIGQQVQPQPSLPRRVALAAAAAAVFTWPPAFIVFAVTTVAAPSVTSDASVGMTAFWALQFAVLIAVAAMVKTMRLRTAEPDADMSTRGTARRVALNALLSGACAGLVLALQGLSIGQIATLTIVLIVVLHLLPVILARLLRRVRARRQASLSDPLDSPRP
ncbi:hypothetical protein [Polymorphospora lycopeni]|uniref:Uncharacterized protein n=1 Tax=Polymorphospora lycopeni TaxID=3140240 RepID=A0ABV5CV66_9ACTN